MKRFLDCSKKTNAEAIKKKFIEMNVEKIFPDTLCDDSHDVARREKLLAIVGDLELEAQVDLATESGIKFLLDADATMPSNMHESFLRRYI